MVTRLKWRFTPSMVADAPDHPGVYVLWRDGKVLAVGHALGAHDTIRSRLQAHASHPEGKHVTHYSWEISREPQRREAQIAEELGMNAEPATKETPEPQRRDKRHNEPAQPE